LPARRTGVNGHSTLDNRVLRADTDAMARVTLEQLCKGFRGPKGEAITAVSNLNLAVADGELLALVGPSGSGKTTVLRLIAGLETITSGTVALDDRVINDLPPQDRDVAMVFQHFALFPHLTAGDNLALGLKLRGLDRAEIARRVGETAALLGLTGLLGRRPKALSGGERQRVALGRALVRGPRLLLLDEPLSNLDAPLRQQLRAELLRLHARLGATMIYVTHDQGEALALGGRVAVLKDGELQQTASPTELYHHPANLFVAGFIGQPAMNLLRGTLERCGSRIVFRARATGGQESGLRLRLPDERTAKLGSHLDREIVLGLRPETLRPTLASEPSAEALTAVVETVSFMGSETWLQLTCGSLSLVAPWPAGQRIERRQAIRFSPDLSRAHFFDATTGRALG
jgi:multiple sugar transport system ATP-binding protein